MHRRDFARILLGSTAALAAGCSARAREQHRRIAITIDDPTTRETPLLSVLERDERLFAALDGVQAALFVCGRRIDSPEGSALLDRWEAHGHILANHSWSHLYYHNPSIDIAKYGDDMIAGEKPIAHRAAFRKLYRFPYLKEGNTVEKRDVMRALLDALGYRNGAVTIDGSDWYFDSRLEKRLTSDPATDIAPYRDAYLAHVRDRATYYDRLAVDVLGATIPHTILLHHSLLNALFLGDLIAMFRSDGWQIIDAEEALADPIYRRRPDVLPAGESLVWSLAKRSGRFEDRLRYPAEDGEYEKERLDALGL